MRWNKITIHHSASRDVSAETIRKWHLRQGFSDIGYHLVIRLSGTLEKGRPLTRTGAHVRGKNEGNIGICLTGNFQVSGFPYYRPSASQYKTLKTLLTILRHTLGIAPENIFQHRDLAPTHCPGKFFDIGRVL